MRNNYLLIGLIVLSIGTVSLLGYGIPSRAFSEAGVWQVTYYMMLEDGVWGEVIGVETFPIAFDYDPLAPTSERVEPIGFKSNMELNIQKDTDVKFTVGADDGVIVLIMDDEVLIHLEAPDPDKYVSYEKNVKVGKYNLEIQYYQIFPVLEDDAHALFGIEVLGADQSRLIKSGFISLIFMGGLTIFLSKKRKTKLNGGVIEKDLLFIVYGLIYLFISSYILISIINLS